MEIASMSNGQRNTFSTFKIAFYEDFGGIDYKPLLRLK